MFCIFAVTFTITIANSDAQIKVEQVADFGDGATVTGVLVNTPEGETQLRLALNQSAYTDTFAISEANATLIPQPALLSVRITGERNPNSNLSDGVVGYGDRVWFEGIAKAPEGPDWYTSYELDMPMSTGWVATTLLGYWQCSCLNQCSSHLETDTIPNRWTLWMTPGGPGCGEYPRYIKFTFTSVIRGTGDVGDVIPLRLTLSERENFPQTRYYAPFAVLECPVVIGMSVP